MEKISNYDVVKEIGKKIGKGAGKITLGAIECVYAFPTFVRKIEGEGLYKVDRIGLDKVDRIGGAIFGLAFMPFASGTIFMYAGSAGPNSPWPLNFAKGVAVGFATNLISALYESFRYTKKQMREKLEKREERNSGKGLENTLNT